MRLSLRLPRRSSKRSDSLGTRARAWCRQFELDRELADGADPSRSPDLQARAEQLTSAHFRRELIAQLDGALAKADHPPHWHSASLPVQSEHVRAAQGPLRALRRALQSSSTGCVQGAALAACLLNDPNGPLYRARAGGSIADLANAATAVIGSATEPRGTPSGPPAAAPATSVARSSQR
jgi:hypothetical protein